jgi:hypothetical protein
MDNMKHRSKLLGCAAVDVLEVQHEHSLMVCDMEGIAYDADAMEEISELLFAMRTKIAERPPVSDAARVNPTPAAPWAGAVADRCVITMVRRQVRALSTGAGSLSSSMHGLVARTAEERRVRGRPGGKVVPPQ